METGIRNIEASVIKSAPICPYENAPWLAPQLFMTEYTDLNAPLLVSLGANHVVGQPGSVLSKIFLWESGSISTEYPSANCKTGPNPYTMLIRVKVIGIPPSVMNLDEKPPPLKYSVVAGTNSVAFMQS